jgi:4Fe-4S single cluster domain
MKIDAAAYSPRSLTIIPTYRCTAQCTQCCFESNPTLRHRLSLETINSRIDDAVRSFPDLEVVVFSGGEVFLLKDDLYAAIAHAVSHGKRVRCVTNASWGKRESHASDVAEKLVNAGLSEINISTGLDHQKWVPFTSVENACSALVQAGINTLITIEADSKDSYCLQTALESSIVTRLLRDYPVLFSLQSNSWMPFHNEYDDRGSASGLAALTDGCTQLFGNVVVNPHDELAACCGLTFEHIPELKLGKLSGGNMQCLYEESFDDFLKIWIHIDGPGTIIRKLFGDNANNYYSNIRHICEACAILHKDEKIRSALKDRYKEFIPEVMARWYARITLRNIESTRQSIQIAPREVQS